MSIPALFGIASIGTLFWLASPELSAVLAVTAGHPVWLIALTCATAQSLVYVILFFSGGRLLARWKWLHDRTLATQQRFGDRMTKSYLGLTALGGVTGLPPCVAMVVLAPAFEVRFWHLLVVVFFARATRFAIIAVLGDGAVQVVRNILG